MINDRLVAAAIALPLLIVLVSGLLGQLLRLQQFVEGFLYAASYRLFDLTLDYFLVKPYNLFRHGLLTPITINLDRKAGQPVRLSLHLVPKLQ